MTYTANTTIVITAAVATALRKVAQMLDKQHTDGMFTTPLSTTGNLPATHWVSSGSLPNLFVNAFANPAALEAAARAKWLADGIAFPYSSPAIAAARASCSISDGTRTVVIDAIPTVVSEGPHEFIARLGLKIIGT